MKQSYTSKEKEAIKEQIEIHTARLNSSGDELEQKALKKIIDDHNKQLDKPTVDHPTLFEALKEQISSLESRLESEEDELVIDGIKQHIEDLKAKLENRTPAKKKK